MIGSLAKLPELFCNHPDQIIVYTIKEFTLQSNIFVLYLK